MRDQSPPSRSALPLLLMTPHCRPPPPYYSVLRLKRKIRYGTCSLLSGQFCNFIPLDNNNISRLGPHEDPFFQKTTRFTVKKDVRETTDSSAFHLVKVERITLERSTKISLTLAQPSVNGGNLPLETTQVCRYGY